jgi:hypothetical protein
VFKPTTEKESLHKISNDSGIMIVSFATFKNITGKNMVFPLCNFHKYTWMSPDGKPHNQIDYILTDRRRQLSSLDVQTFRAVEL